MTLALGVLVSGGGSNLQAILDAIAAGTLDARVSVVLSSRADAYALERATAAGIPTAVLAPREFPSRAAYDEALVERLRNAGVEWIALAGFMRVLTPAFLTAFPDRVLNIHPSLLPAFPGVDAQTQAFEYGVKVAGCTVHFVDDGVDSGPILLQKAVPVLESDDAEALRQRILHVEHEAFVEALTLVAEGRVSLVRSTAGRPRVRIAPR